MLDEIENCPLIPYLTTLVKVHSNKTLNAPPRLSFLENEKSNYVSEVATSSTFDELFLPPHLTRRAT